MSRFALELSAAPSNEIMTTAEAKTHMRVTTSLDDTYIDSIVAAARRYTEDYLDRSLITQTWKLYLDCFPSVIELTRGPVQSITSITYLDPNGDLQTLDSSLYRVDLKSLQPRITPAYNEVWPSIRNVTNSITVTYVAGYGDASTDVPEQIIQAIKLLTGHYYENRESTSPITVNTVPMAYDFLLSTFRLPRV